MQENELLKSAAKHIYESQMAMFKHGQNGDTSPMTKSRQLIASWETYLKEVFSMHQKITGTWLQLQTLSRAHGKLNLISWIFLVMALTVILYPFWIWLQAPELSSMEMFLSYWIYWSVGIFYSIMAIYAAKK